MKHKQENINESQQATPDSLGFGGAAESATETQTENKNLIEKFFAEVTLKSGSKVTASTLTQFIKDGQKSDLNFNNTLRTLTMVSADLIPYGGMFISPIIGLVWPENGGEDTTVMINKLRTELTNLMDEKINTEHLGTLKTEFQTLLGNLKLLEDSVNGRSGEYYSQGSIEGTRREWAGSVQRSFERLLNLTSQDTHKVGDLPLYTNIATAHIQFLEFLHLHGTGPKFKFAKESLVQFFKLGTITENRNKYKKYINETYALGNEKIDKKMKDIAIKVLGKNNPKAQDNLDRMTDVIAALRKERRDYNRSIDLTNLDGRIAQADALYKEYSHLLNQKKDFCNNTWGNTAYQLVEIGKWRKQDGKWHFIDIEGKQKTGWLSLGDKYYYLSPADNAKNYEGATFKKGQMWTGWLKDDTGKWFYLSPSPNKVETNTGTFEEGQMITGDLDITMKGTTKKYQFNEQGECTNP